MVKKLTAFVLIAVLPLQCFYKLACVTYYQLNKDYISNFLCENRANPITICYGQCFLKKALGFESETTANTFASNLKFELPFFKVSQNIIFDNPTLVQKEKYITKNHLLRKEDHAQSIFRPPLF
jgi:hypothetical protein